MQQAVRKQAVGLLKAMCPARACVHTITTGEARRAEALAAILARQQEAAANIREAAARRQQAEAERLAQLEHRQRRKQEVQVGGVHGQSVAGKQPQQHCNAQVFCIHSIQLHFMACVSSVARCGRNVSVRWLWLVESTQIRCLFVTAHDMS